MKKKPERTIIILGGGLAGLSCGAVLTGEGFNVSLYEADAVVGGLSRTVEKEGFRFDLGGHRFLTADREIELFVRNLMESELVSVRRSSKIYMREHYFDYPLKPLNAMFGLGIPATIKILSDYALQSAGCILRKSDVKSLEDWVISRFGRTMFTIYFKEYSEKVWGIDCSRICATWVAQRIKGLSLAKALKNSVFKNGAGDAATLADMFLYPPLGIGRISQRLRDEIETRNSVFTNSPVTSINRAGLRAESITVEHQGRRRTCAADEFVSSIPITRLIGMLNPPPPARILDVITKLKFRDLVIAAVMVDRARVTDQTWIYIPEKKIPFGRIHEPTNWSADMAPPGKSLLVAEFFTFRTDNLWEMTDQELTELTVENLVRLGFIKRGEVLNSMIVRVPNAYPLFEIGYRKHLDELYEYLAAFSNMHAAGRSGMFQYYNMDAALRSGIEAARGIARKSRPVDAVEPDELALAGA